jgi:hypothetical protein
MYKHEILRNKSDIKVGQILLVPILKNGKLISVEKVVKELDSTHDGLRFTDRTWMSRGELISKTPIHIGEIKTIWKFFKYRRYF